MNRSMLKQALGGGYIERYEFDIGKNLFFMRVDVLENGVLSQFDVRFERMSQLLFESESDSIGDRKRRSDMVDHAARNQAYIALHRFIGGETTNDEFESEYPDATKASDRAIKAVETMV